MKHKYTIDMLLDKVNEKLLDYAGKEINIRQLRSDISYMRDSAAYNAPIKAYRLYGNKCYYRYSDERFSIRKTPLSVNDVNNLKSTIEMLSKYRGIPANAWLEQVISNLEHQFGLKSDKEDLISFGQNENLKGLEFLSDAIDYTLNHQPVDILYQPFHGDEIKMTLHPYYLKQYNNRWFLLGYSKHREGLTNAPLDRMLYIYPSDEPFIENTQYDFSTYFDDVIGVTIPDDSVKKERILLQFTPNRFPYVVTKPIHKSQKTIDEDNCIIELQLRRNRELDQLILSFSPDVTVLQPQWYREEIIKKIQQNLEKYKSMY